MSESAKTVLACVGDVSWQTWRGVLQEFNSPILDEGTLAYTAAKPHTAVCLAAMKRASRFGIDLYEHLKSTHNPFLLTGHGSFGGIMEFDSWEDAILYWKAYDFPDERRTGIEIVWDILRLATEYRALDRAHTYSQEIPEYTTEDGQPTDDTLMRWFGYNTQTCPRVYNLWLDWGEQSGIYPSLSGLYYTATGVEYTFMNGLRIHDNGERAMFVGFTL